MTAFISTVIAVLCLAGAYGEAGGSTGSAATMYGGELQATEPVDNARDLLLELQAVSGGASRQQRTLRTVLVVPGPDLAPEAIAQISEDLTIMCRIFDKATVWAKRAAGSEISRTLPVDVSGIEISEHWIGTQALYLDGYGAVFFLPVDFLLAAPQQEQAAPKTESAADPLWSQTADELRGVPQESRGPSRLQYDEQRVESLKAALIGTLRHAANVQTRRAEDAISIVIATRLNQGDRLRWIFGPSNPYGGPFSQQQTVAPAGVSPDLPTVLVLRTSKSDVDALAKGALTQEQFATKVQLLKSWTNPPRSQAGMGGVGGGSGMMGGVGGMGGGMWMPSQNRY